MNSAMSSGCSPFMRPQTAIVFGHACEYGLDDTGSMVGPHLHVCPFSVTVVETSPCTRCPRGENCARHHTIAIAHQMSTRVHCERGISTKSRAFGPGRASERTSYPRKWWVQHSLSPHHRHCRQGDRTPQLPPRLRRPLGHLCSVLLAAPALMWLRWPRAGRCAACLGGRAREWLRCRRHAR